MADHCRPLRSYVSNGGKGEGGNLNGRAVPKRVLQVLEATLGGTRRYLENVFDALGAGPDNGLVYSLHRADTEFLRLLERLREARWTLFEVDMRRPIDPRRDLTSVLALRAIYRSFKPDVVHAHASKAGAIARLATFGMRRRPGIVYSPHAIGVHLGWIYRLIEHVLALRLDILSAVTPSERDELRALKLLPSGRIYVVVPAIRSDIYAPADRVAARSRLGLNDGPLVIAIGRLTLQNGPLAFVDLVAALKTRVGDVRGIWVGDGELRNAMEERIKCLGLQPQVSIAGWQDDVRPYIAASDLLVSTSVYESFGYVTAEAMAMDRPVVASAVTGTTDVVATDVGQQLYRSGDISGAVKLAERLLRNGSCASAIAERGRRHVLSTFSTDAMLRGLIGAYAAAAERC
jgi:glycosyltransferase involved in cell wall biosynthesis